MTTKEEQHRFNQSFLVKFIIFMTYYRFYSTMNPNCFFMHYVHDIVDEMIEDVD